MDFAQIYQLYFHDVYLFLKSLALSDQLAEELSQETFHKALKSLHQFDGRKDIRAWLFTIARNTYYSHYQQAKRQMPFPAEAEPADTGITILEQITDQEQAFIIHQFLHQMEEPYKEVFTLRVFGELPFEKIGLLFGKNASWARVTFYRDKQKIIAYLEVLDHDEKNTNQPNL